MSFLFGKSKKDKPIPTGLPQATREIGSSHGQSSIPAPNGIPAADKARLGAPQQQTPTPGSSVNNSLNSLQGNPNATSPEPKTLRERSDSDMPNGRPQLGPPVRIPTDSPYPWSQRRIHFTSSANPFPRYGAAVNATAAKDGSLYLMGGLINGSTVKGDLWMLETGNPSLPCYPVATTSEGPGPRVGHSSLLVGNAFIVFGGDTKMDDRDELDDTLYLLNTSSKQWSRALPAGPRPSGRYGHTLNILGSKIYIFGGQVEGYFFNDLVAFDLNALQLATCRWEVLLPNNPDGTSMGGALCPPARTNHSMITWHDKLYLFGGTDGQVWFNDVWTYDPATNAWTELDCIGYIPLAREGHAAALVNDTMYVFGGRTREGNDLDDLAAFRISSRRWYMFQNMGPSPSPRSGHSMSAYGKQVVVVGGEPSSAPRDPSELSLAYVLDTSKIRYPASEQQAPSSQQNAMGQGQRKMSAGERTGIPMPRQATTPPAIGPPSRDPNAPVQQFSQGPQATQTNGMMAQGSRLPRANQQQQPSGPPPQQQAPQPRQNGAMGPPQSRTRTPTNGERGYGPPVDTRRGPSMERARSASMDRERQGSLEKDNNISPAQSPSTREMDRMLSREQSPNRGPFPQQPPPQQQYNDGSRGIVIPSREGSRSHRQKPSVDSVDHHHSRPSLDASRSASRQAEQKPVDSGFGSSPAFRDQHDELTRELEAARSRNAWYASELALARKAGYHPNASSSPILDERAADMFSDDDKPLLEALLKMRNELSRVQGVIDGQTGAAAEKIAEVEKQRDAAISEAVYAKAKLAAHGGSQAGTPQPDGTRDTGSPDLDRVNELNRRLATSLGAHGDATKQLESLKTELESEKRARQLAEESAEAAHSRVSELDNYRQQNASEVESLRAQLHEAERNAREASANHADATSRLQMLELDKNELHGKHTRAMDDAKSHSSIVASLRDAVTASTEKANLLERKLEEAQNHRDLLEQKLSQLRSEHEARTSELEGTTRRLRDTEELAERHAEEAKTHRAAVLSGLDKVTSRDLDEDDAATDERVTLLQQQVEAANAMARQHQEAANTAYEKLRSAEERIAGLEQYQEQTSREALTVRKQLHAFSKEVQSHQSEKAELQKSFEKHRLESNAQQVQLKTLKNLLEERGISAADVRRSRVLDSPSSRFSTPDLNRVRELEQQLEDSLKAHDEMRGTFEDREQTISKEYQEKLAALDNDHRAAVEYLRGTERMLSKMKQELARYKSNNSELKERLAKVENDSRSTSREAPPAEWETERNSLRKEISAMQDSLQSSVGNLEAQLSNVRSELAAAHHSREAATTHAKELESQHQQARADLDSLRHENSVLEERAREAEQRVQLFLDQFETSVDNYRRQSQMTEGHGAPNGIMSPREMEHPQSHGPTHSHGHSQQQSISGDSVYSTSTAGAHDGGAPESGATRNSMALDNLATELDALRNHWESTNKAYRLSDRFDFERTPTTPGGQEGMLSESLASWRKRMDLDEDSPEKERSSMDRERKGSLPSRDVQKEAEFGREKAGHERSVGSI